MNDNTGNAPFDFLKAASFGLRKKREDDRKKYATFNRRMMAATIDSLALMFTEPLVDMLVPVKNMAAQLDASDPLAMQKMLTQSVIDPAFIASWFGNLAVQMLLFCLYSAVCWHFWSATPGKILLRIKIVDADSGQPITGEQIWRRILGYAVSSVFLFLGFIWIGFDKRRQGWHDKMANTVVIVLPWMAWEKYSDIPPT